MKKPAGIQYKNKPNMTLEGVKASQIREKVGTNPTFLKWVEKKSGAPQASYYNGFSDSSRFSRLSRPK